MADTYNPATRLSREGFWLLLSLTGLGWMALFYVLGRTPGPATVVFSFFGEIAKAAFIGSSAALILAKFFVKTDGVERGLIEHVYPDKRAIEPVIQEAVKDPHTRSLTLVGVSLRDFLLMNGSLSDVWLALCDRLTQEDADDVPLADRLKVRVLLLQPLSHEGQFRYQIEKPALPQGLLHDVPMAVGEIERLRHELSAGVREEVIEVRLYDHGSFAFQFLTNNFVIVQQYLYRDQNQPAALPYISYTRTTAAYRQLSHSVDIVWKHAHRADIDPNRVGTSKGSRESRMVGIYRQADRSLLGNRQRDVLRSARAGDIVDIQAISARFYLQAALQEIQEATGRGGRGAKVRILVLNPIGRAAILRAVADNTPIERIGDALRSWSFERHRASRLYNDVRDAISTVQRLKPHGVDIDLRLAVTELPCALLIARDAAFVEQYLYGRSRAFDTGVVLGGEYAVHEYAHNAADVTTEEKILRSAFEVIWESFSVSADAYLGDEPSDEAAGFEAELHGLLRQLHSRITPPTDKIAVVVLAAGYGTRFLAELDRRPELRERVDLRVPKALLPIAGRPVLEWTISQLEQLPEVGDITVLTNERYADAFEQWKARGTLRRPVKIVSNGTSTNEGRGGALGDLDFIIRREQITRDVLVVGGDNFFGGGFEELVAAFRVTGRGQIAVHREGRDRIAGKLGAVEMNSAGEVVGFEEKPQRPRSEVASTFCYLFSNKEIKLLKEFVRSNPGRDNAGDFIRHIVSKRHPLQAVECQHDWFDIGSYSEYCRADEIIKAKFSDRTD